MEEHVRHLEQVLTTLQENHLYLNAKKCKFGVDNLIFLGHKISSEGVTPDPEKVAAIQNWPVPKNLHEIRGFLGFVNFYRKYIPRFAEIALPLTNLTRTTLPDCGKMNPQAEAAFNSLKQQIASAPVLVYPHTGGEAEFAVSTDASGSAIGYTLQQDQGKGLQPVAFEARSLNRHEQNYSIHEKELLAVVEAFKKFRPYLEGCKKVTVYTDHKALTTLMSQKDLAGRKARWVERLSPFTSYMDIKYKPVKDNCADGVSRRPDRVHQITEVTPELMNKVKQNYCKDPAFSPDARLPAHVYQEQGSTGLKGKSAYLTLKSLRLRSSEQPILQSV